MGNFLAKLAALIRLKMYMEKKCYPANHAGKCIKVKINQTPINPEWVKDQLIPALNKAYLDGHKIDG